MTGLARTHDGWLDEMRPYFVYGTLRPGEHNDRKWQGLAHASEDGAVYVKDYALYMYGGLPIAVPQNGAYVVGALIWPKDATKTQLRYDFDLLEGHPAMYERTEVKALTEFGNLTCWMYVWKRPYPDAIEEKTGDYTLAQEVAAAREAVMRA